MSDSEFPPFGPSGNSSTSAVLQHWHWLQDQHRRVSTSSSGNFGQSAAVFSTVGTGTMALTGQTPELVISDANSTVVAADLPVITVGVALVEFGGKNDEGQFILAVTPAWTRILNELGRNPQALLRLTPRQLEELVAGAYREQGWTVTLTPRSGDGGVDIIARRDDVGSIRLLDQVKLYKPSHLVDADEVRAMWGVLLRDNAASKACITTTSAFAPGVYMEFKDSIPTRLDLRNGTELNEWLTTIYPPGNVGRGRTKT